jgi:hypothetical protein
MWNGGHLLMAARETAYSEPERFDARFDGR